MDWTQEHRRRLQEIEIFVEQVFIHDELIDFFESMIDAVNKSISAGQEANAIHLLELLERAHTNVDWEEYVISDYTKLIQALERWRDAKNSFYKEFPIDRIEQILNNCTEWEVEEFSKLMKECRDRTDH